MSDIPGAGSDAAPTELSEQQVMDGIEGLLDERPRRERRPQRQQNQPQEAASDVAAETEEPGPDPRPGPEDPAPSEEVEEEGDQELGEDESEPGHQRIDPPESWTKEDKAVFQSLPPEAQAVIARRESEQNRAFFQKTQEIAEHRRALESTFSEIQSERQSYAQNLQQLLFVAAPEAERFANVDWQRLASEQPAEYVNLSAQRDALRGRIAGIQGELQRVSAQAQQAQYQQFAALKQVEYQKLVEAIPDYGDPQKGPQRAADTRAFLLKRGFSEQEISQVVDSRVIVVVDELMQADRVRRARNEAESKRSTAATAVQPPGNGRQRSDTGAAQRRNQKMAQLRRSGSEKDAISLLMDIL